MTEISDTRRGESTPSKIAYWGVAERMGAAQSRAHALQTSARDYARSKRLLRRPPRCPPNAAAPAPRSSAAKAMREARERPVAA